ncbi:hypothetical protein [Jeotgalicoccus sp. WY2]|uniref:hypothetical protein n=1 Tax=Jeotgalicoccus sp. WY2 TaxID=2708346 RepID=UPI001BD39241|nr:hypothetical protein [Jeotgalicoccus sp. WY2]
MIYSALRDQTDRVYEKTKEFKKPTAVGSEYFDNKPEKGEYIVTKDRRTFVVRAVLHRSQLTNENYTGDEPTTELIVEESEIFLT